MNLQGLIKHVPKIGYGNRIRPLRDWFVLLAVALILLIASVAWNAWLFFRVTSGEGAASEAPVTSTPVLDALPKAREVLEIRASEETRYRSLYEFVDPAR